MDLDGKIRESEQALSTVNTYTYIHIPISTWQRFLNAPFSSPGGPGMEKTWKDKAVDICIHYTYIQKSTFNTTPSLRVRARARFSSFFSNSFSLYLAPPFLQNYA